MQSSADNNDILQMADNFYNRSISLYSIIEMFATSPSWSIPGKNTNQKNQKTPSPCNYFPDKWNTMHSPSWKIGTSQRNRNNNNIAPGPGQYQPLKIDNSNKFGKFNKENYHVIKNNQNPAPTQYSPNFKYNRPSTPSSKIAMKPKQEKPSSVPGPGQYQPKLVTKNNTANTKIGLQKRFMTEKVDGPGPQAYNPNKDNFKKVSVGFTKQNKRFNSCYQNQQVKAPGPGSYATQDIFQASIKQNRGFSISSKSKQPANNQNPGPGQYDPHYVSQPQSPKVSMKGKHMAEVIANNPGPAQYFVQDVFKNVRNGFSIGKSQRTQTNFYKTNPGPGSYNPNPKSLMHQTPKYSIYGSRIDQPKTCSPGPGSYNPDKNAIKRRPLSAKIGNSKRCEFSKQNSPGPGEYQIKSRPQTPSNSFKKQTRGKQSTYITPGPADYKINQIFGQTQPYFRKS